MALRQKTEAVVEDASTPNHGRRNREDSLEGVLKSSGETPLRRDGLHIQLVLSEREAGNQRNAVFNRLSDESESLGQNERKGAGARGKSFHSAANNEDDSFAGSRTSVFISTKKMVDVLSRRGGKTAEKKHFSHEGEEEPAAESEQVGGETWKEIGESGCVGDEGAKSTDGDNSVRMITEDVGPRRIEIRGLDETNREVVPEVVPDAPFTDGEYADVFADGEEMASAASVHFALIDDVPKEIEKREPPILRVKQKVIVDENAQEAVAYEQGDELQHGERLQSTVERDP